MSMSLDALFKLAEKRAAEEEAKPLEQRRREYREKHFGCRPSMERFRGHGFFQGRVRAFNEDNEAG